ncbi:MAG: DUF4258 domain-containing protein [Rhodospirillales bacterium]|nr:DUF4258 domain-containing protein [Rhodospirillales bacterium]
MIDLANAVFTDHALRQMARRGLAERHVEQALAAPDAVRQVRPGRVVAQKILHIGEPARDTLVRVFVDIDRVPPEIVTAYRTSKLAKYRSA